MAAVQIDNLFVESCENCLHLWLLHRLALIPELQNVNTPGARFTNRLSKIKMHITSLLKAIKTHC